MANRLFTKYKILTTLWIILPFALWCVPLESILEGNSICLFKRFFGTECYGCGTTRAVFSLLHLHFYKAWEYNHLIVLIAPVLLYLYIKVLLTLIKKVKDKDHTNP